MFLLKPTAQALDPAAAGDGKDSEVVGYSRRLGRDEVSQGLVVQSFGLRPLLPEGMKNRTHGRPGVIRVHFNIVTHAIGGEKAIDRLRGQQVLLDDLLQERLGVVEQFFRFRPDLRILEDLWIAPPQLPGMKKRRPVDGWYDALKRDRIQHARAEKGRLWDVQRRPVAWEPALSR